MILQVQLIDVANMMILRLVSQQSHLLPANQVVPYHSRDKC